MFLQKQLIPLLMTGAAIVLVGTNASASNFENVAAIFGEHCVRCHHAGKFEGDFRLDDRDAMLESGMVSAGDEDSLLLALIAGPEPSMPKDAPALTADEVRVVRQWIVEGASWPDGQTIREKPQADKTWWSLQSLAAQPSAASIDRFVDDELAKAGLQRNKPADRQTLIRRATYDLIGLPPTPEEFDQFVADDTPKAYEDLIDRLLASPHYGERWGRHWLDVVRFGESNGFERNILINDLWPFRDYVIRSLNEDKPFDQLLREHLAGDVLGPGDVDVEMGSAFLVAGPYDNVNNQDAEQVAQIRANTIDEMIRATTEAFLGLTVGCARCHDHKFDPIQQADYYRLYATFAGTRHGSRVIATNKTTQARKEKLAPLNHAKQRLEEAKAKIEREIERRVQENAGQYAKAWTRPKPNRQGTEESFSPVTASFVRLTCESQDIKPATGNGFRIDEFEIWTSSNETVPPRNVALASAGAIASGPSRTIEDFAGAYGPHLAIDGKAGERFISSSNYLTVQMAEPTSIERVVFSSAKDEAIPEHRKFVFVADYRIEVSVDGERWTEVANGSDRKSASEEHRKHRIRKQEVNQDEQSELAGLSREIAKINRQINAEPPLLAAWIGTHVADEVKGPFHVFLGGSPGRKGNIVVPASLSTLSETAPSYELADDASESDRRLKLAQWMTDPSNPLPSRVIANRLWHYHFGTGIVNTPNDFGFMGGRPSHPELLDYLASQLQTANWRLKPIHKQIMMSEAYRQSSQFDRSAAAIDADSRLLWRFPSRRLSAEEIRDTMLTVAGKLDLTMGGPGFRLYKYLQDNVATYVPLDEHGNETYRRAVYHQNARAARIDLMTEFDQPDCAFSAARRVDTTTPLQALTALNHTFTLDMAKGFAERLQSKSAKPSEQIDWAYRLLYGRLPAADEKEDCIEFLSERSLKSLCRVLLNTSELIHVR